MAIINNGGGRVNTAIAGAQSAPEVTALAGGGFVIGWRSSIGDDAFIQRFDGFGNRVGDNVQVGLTANAGGEAITDIVGLANGDFVVAWKTTGLNGAAYGSPSVTNGAAFKIFRTNGTSTADTLVVPSDVSGPVKLLSTATGFRVIFESANGLQYYAKDYLTTGVAGSTYQLASFTTSSTLVDAVQGATGDEILLLTDTGTEDRLTRASIAFSTAAATVLRTAAEGDVLELEQLEPHLHVAVGTTGTAVNGIRPASSVDLVTSTGLARIWSPGGSPNDVAVTSLGSGRVLVTTVEGASSQKQVSVWVHDLATGSVESTVLASYSGAQSIDSLDATTLADGRTLISWAASNNITGGEIHYSIVDARISGIAITGTTSADIFAGTNWDDTLRGGSGNDVLIGNQGNDYLAAGAGLDYIDGGTGTDTVSYAERTAGVNLRVDVFAPIPTTVTKDVAYNVEVVEGSRLDDLIYNYRSSSQIFGMAGNDYLWSRTTSSNLFGGDGNDVLVAAFGASEADGGIGDDRLYGGAPDDRLVGGDGADYLSGRAGDDVLDGDAGDDAVAAGDGKDTVHGGLGRDHLLGDLGDDFLNGGADDDRIDGQQGADLVLGMGGNDRLWGGYGKDELDGGDGDDILYGFVTKDDDEDILTGGAGVDLADYLQGSFGVVVDLAQGRQALILLNEDGLPASEQTQDSLLQIENVRGSTLADRLIGDDGANLLDGRQGNDVLTGGAGNDVLLGYDGLDLLRGGAGADTMNGGGGLDTADYGDETAGISIDLNTNANTGGALGDLLIAIENVIGTAQNDTIVGNRSNNFLDGNLGDDTLTGGRGSDVLQGGAGRDTFRFIHLLDGGDLGDVIVDFELGFDRIGLVGTSFGGITAADLGTRFTANANGTPIAGDTNPQIIFDNAGSDAGRVLYDLDGSGARGPFLLCTIIAPSGELSGITAADFVIL